MEKYYLSVAIKMNPDPIYGDDDEMLSKFMLPRSCENNIEECLFKLLTDLNVAEDYDYKNIISVEKIRE